MTDTQEKTFISLTNQVKELEKKIDLRDQIIDNQRKMIFILRQEIKKKRWYNFWK